MPAMPVVQCASDPGSNPGDRTTFSVNQHLYLSYRTPSYSQGIQEYCMVLRPERE